MPDLSVRQRIRFIDGPRDGEEIFLTLQHNQWPPEFWRHVTTIDQPMHVYRRTGWKPGLEGRFAWEYEWIGNSSRPAHKFSLRGAFVANETITGR